MKSKGHDLVFNLFFWKKRKTCIVDNILNFHLKKTEWNSDKNWQRSLDISINVMIFPHPICALKCELNQGKYIQDMWFHMVHDGLGGDW